MPSDHVPQPSPTGHPGPLELAIKLGLIVLLILLCFQIMAPFLLPVLWGVILAIALYGGFTKISSWLNGHQNWAAALITVLTLVLLLGPVGILAAKLVENLQDVATELQTGAIEIPAPPPAVIGWPFIGEPLYSFWTLAATDLDYAISEQASYLEDAGRWLLDLAAGLGGGFLQFLFAVLIAGLLLPNAASARRAIFNFADKVTEENGAYLVNLSGATIRNVAVGIMGIALLQSLLSGMAFLAIEVPAAGLLAFLVLLFSAVQIGPLIVVVPVIGYVFWTAELLPAILFTAWIIPVSFLDTALKPILVSRGLDTPMIVIFVGVIGGTLSFGIVGLFVGPVALGIGYKLLTEWTRRDDDQSVLEAGE